MPEIAQDPAVAQLEAALRREHKKMALVQDVGAARARADAVVVSLHWGLHFIPRALADYQPLVARSAFET